MIIEAAERERWRSTNLTIASVPFTRPAKNAYAYDTLKIQYSNSFDVALFAYETFNLVFAFEM